MNCTFYGIGENNENFFYFIDEAVKFLINFDESKKIMFRYYKTIN